MGITNRTDITAAMKAWMQTLTQSRKLAVEPRPVLLDSVGDMVSALRQKQIDVLAAPSDEFFAVEKLIPLSRPYSTRVGGRMTEQYVLLVRSDRGFKGLKELRGETLLVLEQSRNALAPVWLDCALLEQHLPASERFFGRVTRTGKLNLTVLPVFFKQAGAALVNRRNFEAAVELNPQLAKELCILAASPWLIPELTSYRSDTSRIVAENYLKEAEQLTSTPAGRMILDMFQIEGVSEVKEGELAETRAFLAAYAKLKAEWERKGAAP
jgi:ABC-type phosphate/phosphonate transport system substrate-binding protein